MTTKSNGKSKNQMRGGVRPGAGRPRGSRSTDRRALAVDLAMAGLDRALKAYDSEEGEWTPLQHRWHLAMVMFGVSSDTIAAALFKPQVSKNFSRDVANAIKAVEADCD